MMHRLQHLHSKRRTYKVEDASFPLTFHVLDIIVRSTKAARATDISSSNIPDKIQHDDEEEVFVYVIGAQANGSSVCVEVTGFRPFLYFSIPQSWTALQVKEFVNYFTESVEVVIERRWKFFGYEPNKYKWAKLSFPTIKSYYVFASMFSRLSKKKHVQRARGALELPIPMQYRSSFEVHMKMADLSLFFQIETGITVSKWVKVACGTVQSMPFASTSYSLSCTTKDISPNDDVLGLPPLVVGSFDIESYSPSGIFDSHKPENKVINIGIVISTYPGTDTIRLVLCLGNPSPSQEPDTHFLCYEDEGQLLSGFRDVMQYWDVDILTGYNIFNYDYRFMCDRWERISKMRFLSRSEWERYNGSDRRLYHKSDDFPESYETYEEYHAAFKYFSALSTTYGYQGKMLDEECIFTIKELNSSAMGENKMYRFDKPGRPDIDMWLHIKNNFNLDKYKLDFVAKHFLGGDGKIDLDYNEMFALFEEGTPGALERIATYCVKDCDLPLAMLWKLNILENANEMAVVCSTKISDIFTRGQQIKAYNLICRFSLNRGYVVNYVEIPKPETYVGATVLEPVPGYHEKPIATLDFASLYPSIIRAHNLCYSTLVMNRRFMPSKYAEFQAGGKPHVFVHQSERAGILPEILSELLNARKLAKKAMKKATDPFKKSIQNGRQLALKIACNSVYGFTGVQKGYLPCWPIAATTTTIGRGMIDDSKRISEKTFPHSAQCIYGDTDSVMIKFNDLPSSMEGMKACFQRGLKLGDILTDFFGKQTGTEGIIVMEMEKACWPFLNWPEKKRYISRYFEQPDGPPKIDAKGVQLVRRDGAPVMVQLYKEVVDCIMPLHGEVKSRDQIAEEITDTITTKLKEIEANKLPIKDYIISKSLKATYKSSNLPHVQLRDKMLKRIANHEMTRDPPKSGDRLSYVIVEGKGKSKVYERAEDPEWAVEHGMKLDLVYYIKQQLQKPIVKLVKYFSNVDPLFQRYINTMHRKQSGNQSITKFFGKRESNNNVEVVVRPVAPPPEKKRKTTTSKRVDIRSFFQ